MIDGSFRFKEKVEVAAAAFDKIPEWKRPAVRTGRVWERRKDSVKDRGGIMVAVRLDHPFPGGHGLHVTDPPMPCENGFGWYVKREFVKSIEEG